MKRDILLLALIVLIGLGMVANTATAQSPVEQALKKPIQTETVTTDDDPANTDDQDTKPEKKDKRDKKDKPDKKAPDSPEDSSNSPAVRLTVKGRISALTDTAITVVQKDDSSLTLVLDDLTQIKLPGPEEQREGGLQIGMQVTIQAIEQENTLLAVKIHMIPTHRKT